MTRADARRTLDAAQAQIDANVDAYFAGTIDLDTFRARQREAHAAIDAAGMQDAFCRRWRRAHAAA